MKPCPFCGNRNLKLPPHSVVAWVVCLNCGAEGPLAERRYPEDIGVQFDAIAAQAIDLWDNRVEIKYKHIKIDDEVLAWNDKNEKDKYRGHFAGMSPNGKPMTFASGKTSLSSNGPGRILFVWEYCEKINE